MRKIAFLFAYLLLTVPCAKGADANLVELVKEIRPAVATVITYDEDKKLSGQGSGFFIDKEGHLITNYHVLKGAYSAEVKTFDSWNSHSLEWLDNDGIVNFNDFAILAKHWLDSCSEPNWCEWSDFDRNYLVNHNDLFFLVNSWLSSVFELTVNVVGGYGTVSISPSPPSGLYEPGTVVTLTAIPDPTYQLNAWTGTDDDASTSNINTVTMDSSKVVTVEFEQKPTLKLLYYGEPAPDYIVTTQGPHPIGMYLEEGATCTEFQVAFVVGGPCSLHWGYIIFPTPFLFFFGPYLGVTTDQYVEVWGMNPTPVSGPCVIVDELHLYHPYEFEYGPLSIIVTGPTLINGEDIPVDTILHQVQIMWY